MVDWKNWALAGLGILVAGLITVIILQATGVIPSTLSSPSPPPPASTTTCNTQNIDQNLQPPEWTLTTWVRVKQPQQNSQVFQKGNSPQLAYENQVLKYKWTTPTNQKIETKGNAFTNEKPLTEWKHFAWTQNQNKMKMYEDGKLFFENDPNNNNHVVVSGTPASPFTTNSTVETANSGVCGRELSQQEIMDIYLKEKPMETMTLNLRTPKIKKGMSLVPIGRQ